MNTKDFADYCWEFYAPHAMYGHFFNHTLTRSELNLAVSLRIVGGGEAFGADSLDREAVRDLILNARGMEAMGL